MRRLQVLNQEAAYCMTYTSGKLTRRTLEMQAWLYTVAGSERRASHTLSKYAGDLKENISPETPCSFGAYMTALYP